MKKVNEIKSQAWDILTERKWFGPVIISLFTMLLSLAVTFMGIFFGSKNLYIDLLIQFMLHLCIAAPFSMGARIYMLKFIRNEEVSVGNVFDGYQFALKLIPIIIVNMAVSALLGTSMNLYAYNPGNMLYALLFIAVTVVSLIVSAITGFSQYLIYDNDGKVFCAIKQMTVYMLKGGIIKYTIFILSYILWFAGIIISMGMLTFFVLPYLEVARAVFYDDINI